MDYILLAMIIIILLVWGICILQLELKQLELENIELEKSIKELIDVNVKLSQKIHKLFTIIKS